MILFGDFAISGLGSSGFNLGTFGIGGGFGVPYSFMVIVAGLGAIGSGISKLVEAARVSAAPGNTLVHGAARPAAETEAQAAARGTPKRPTCATSLSRTERRDMPDDREGISLGRH